MPMLHSKKTTPSLPSLSTPQAWPLPSSPNRGFYMYSLDGLSSGDPWSHGPLGMDARRNELKALNPIVCVISAKSLSR